MSVRTIRRIGDPVLRERARELGPDELASPRVQDVIDDLIDTRADAHGAGLAANQIGETLRIFVVEVESDNPRYPYKPPYPLTVLVNPVLEPLPEDGTVLVNEGCLSIPGLRGDVDRSVSIRARFLDRDGMPQERVVRGLTAGTFQHELDHLDGVLFPDRADPRSLATWEEWERHGRDAFLARIADLPRS